jgi:polyphenol oxidase
MIFTLPKPSDGFDWVQLPAGPAIVCRRLDPYPHLFTTRTWRLGSTPTPNDHEAWSEVAAALDVDSFAVARLKQVHGAAAVTHRRGESTLDNVQPEADIVISDNPGLALAVQTADCVPVLMVDQRLRVVAAVHAGWRGLAVRAPVTAVQHMAREYGTRVEDLLVAIGPAIGQCCYEVGPDVRTQFERGSFTSAQLARWFSVRPIVSAANSSMASLSRARREGHWFFDASQSARDQLESAGVTATALFVSGLCTASHPDVFCSYRRDGSPAGRMAAAIRLDQ